VLRKLAAVALAVSFLALASSGLFLAVVERPSLTIQLHPVHKLFGFVLVLAAGVHVLLNARALLNHLRTRAVAVTAALLVVALVGLYAVALSRPVPPELARQMDEAAATVERGR
jgi:heme A synthase